MQRQAPRTAKWQGPLLLGLCLLLASLPLASQGKALVETEVSPLLWDDSPGPMPNPQGFTSTGYWDESIRVELEVIRRKDMDFYTAFVTIKHPSQLRTGLAKSLGGGLQLPTDLSAHYNGVVAINGDFYTDRNRGLVIRQGEILRSSLSSQYDILLIDQEGNFHIVLRSQPEMLDFYLEGALTIQNAFSFGPALVMEGQPLEIPEKYPFAPHYKNPRAAIGQLGPLQYALVVVDGRQEDEEGVTLETLAQHMAAIGCIQAFNLDGGGSATLMLNSQMVTNKAASTERKISDILYFATTVDPVAWQE